MKRLTVLLLMVLFTLQSEAQYSKKVKELNSERYGAKVSGGLVLTRSEITFVGNEADYVIHQVELARTLPQISFGLFGRKRFGWLYTEASAMYSQYGMVFDVKSYSKEKVEQRDMTERFGYIDLQVMGGLTSEGFRIGVGPVMHILANHNSELEVLENYYQKLRKISYGFSGCIGYDIGSFSFDLKYDKAFRTVGDHIYYGNKKSLFLETPDALSFSIAYAFIR